MEKADWLNWATQQADRLDLRALIGLLCVKRIMAS